MVIEYSSVPITFKQTIYHVITLMCVCWEWSHAVEIIDCMIDRHYLQKIFQREDKIHYLNVVIDSC